ncbi:MAG TPA: hypothetical protein VHN77_08425 [Phycisphaerales bacterium]|nr:hypothetical protein [Phycisphaerales bacterium]
MTTRAILSLAALALAAGAAHAAPVTWDWTSSVSNPGVSRDNGGGTFKSVHTEFNADTNRFLLSVVFSNRITNGLTLRVGDGTSNPSNRGEQAVLFFDAASLSSPKLTAYAYNGVSSESSISDANGWSWGSPTGDMIHGANSTSWINSISAANTPNNTRTFTLDIDASAINGHSPAYAGPNGGSAWDGLRFGNSIRLWMETYDAISTSYSTSGRISCWDASYCSGEGSFIACDNNLVIVPLPPAAYAGLAGLGLAGLVVRRRAARANQD